MMSAIGQADILALLRSVRSYSDSHQKIRIRVAHQVTTGRSMVLTGESGYAAEALKWSLLTLSRRNK